MIDLAAHRNVGGDDQCSDALALRFGGEPIENVHFGSGSCKHNVCSGGR
jgi:hypothetical protein